MLYKGQRLSDLTGDQLEEAEAYAIENLQHARTQYQLNAAFIEEVGEEHNRRIEAARKLN